MKTSKWIIKLRVLFNMPKMIKSIFMCAILYRKQSFKTNKLTCMGIFHKIMIIGLVHFMDKGQKGFYETVIIDVWVDSDR